ncbi:MAG: aa3-type cytochrome c oxidase subunit IV [Pseudomonadota bacterium]
MGDQKHEHGSMDVTEQQRVFAGFMRWTARTLVLIIIVLGFMAITQT